MSLPEKDRYSYSRKELIARLAMMFGGRISEELVFGEENVTTGASDDIKQATGLARRMVTEWGMSDKLGPLRYSDNEEEVFLGHSVTQRKNVSDATAKVIDEEIRRYIDDAGNNARRILTDHRDDLDTIADGLLEYETLTADDIEPLLKGEPLHRPADTEPPSEDAGSRSAVPTTDNAKNNLGGELNPEPQPGS